MTIIITLLIAGVLLIAAEIFLPGMIAGLVGAGCMAAATIMTYQDFGAKPAIIMLICQVIFGTILFLLWIKYFPSSAAGRVFSLPETDLQRSNESDTSGLVGKEGTTLTDLHPSGVAHIDGKRTDVISEGRLIDKDRTIRVVKTEGSRIVVREI